MQDASSIIYGNDYYDTVTNVVINTVVSDDGINDLPSYIMHLTSCILHDNGGDINGDNNDIDNCDNKDVDYLDFQLTKVLVTLQYGLK